MNVEMEYIGYGGRAELTQRNIANQHGSEIVWDFKIFDANGNDRGGLIGGGYKSKEDAIKAAGHMWWVYGE